MRVAAVQFQPVFGDVPRNLERIASLMPDSCDLVVFPELCTTGYAFENRTELSQLAEPADGPTVGTFLDLAKRHDSWIVAGFAESDGDRIYNSAVLAGPQGQSTVYRKIHVFGTEKQVFDCGTEPWPVVDCGGFNVGLMICFDWRFPEAARCLGLQGADILAHPSNLVLPHAPEAMVTRALENGVYTVTANRIGREIHAHHDFRFIGRSRIISPNGEVLQEAGENDEALLVAECDIQRAREKRVAGTNHLFFDRRPELYARITEPLERPLRRNVAIAALDNQGRVLAGERKGLPGAWQLPQGGIDEGENAQAAALREFEEETGCAEVEILAHFEGFSYRFPDWLRHQPIAQHWAGQEQEVFVVRYREGHGPDLSSATSDEFSSLQWMEPEALLDGIVDFKREAYKAFVKRLNAWKRNNLS